MIALVNKETTNESVKEKKENDKEEEGLTVFTMCFQNVNLRNSFNIHKIPNISLSVAITSIILIYSIGTSLLCLTYSTVDNHLEIVSLIITCVKAMIVLTQIVVYIMMKRNQHIPCFYTRNKHLLLMSFIYVIFSLTHIIMKCQLSFIFKEVVIPRRLFVTSTTELMLEIDFDYIFLFSDIIIKFIWVVGFWNDFIYIFFSNLVSFATIFGMYILNTKLQFTLKPFCHLPLYFAFYLVISLISYSLGKLEKKLYLMNYFHKSAHHLDILDHLNSGFMVVKNRTNQLPVTANISAENNLEIIGFPNFEIKYLNKFFEKETEFFEGISVNREKDDNCCDIPFTESKEIFARLLSDLMDVNNAIFDSEGNVQIIPSFPVKSRHSIRESKDFILKGKLTETAHLVSQLDITGGNKDSSSISLQKGDMNCYHLLELTFRALKSSEKFSYLGKKKIMKEQGNKVLVLDIFVRVRDSIAEFLFNDVTKTSLYQGYQQLIIESGQYLHDFKNPLICINDEMNDLKLHNDYIYNVLFTNFPEYQESNYDDYQGISAKYEYLIKISEYCRGLIASYEDFSRMIFKPKEIIINSDAFELWEILTFIETMINLKISKSKKQINFTVQNGCEGRKIVNDKTKLQQVLINILTNALKFTPNGSISLIVTNEMKNNKRYFKFLIKDTGIGMSESVVNNLCTPFYSLLNGTMNKEGCGLGLTIVKGLTEKLGIGLQVHSRLGQGTQMWFHAEDMTVRDAILGNDTNNHLQEENLTEIKTITQTTLQVNLQRPSVEKHNESGEMLSYTLEKEALGVSCKSLAIDNPKRNSCCLPLTPEKKKKNVTFSAFKTFINSNNLVSLKTLGSENQATVPRFSLSFKIDLPEDATVKAKFDMSKISPSSAISFEIKSLGLYSKCRANEKNKFSPGSSQNQMHIVVNPTCEENPTFDLNNKYLIELSESIIQKNDREKPNARDASRNSVYSKFNDYLNKVKNECAAEDNLEKSSNESTVKVLIVDDDENIRGSTKKLLQKIQKSEPTFCFKIDEADDGFSGLIKIIQKAIDTPQDKYDMIILDEEMNYLNGTDLFKLLSYITTNRLAAKSRFDMNITGNVLICSADAKNVRNKVSIHEDLVISKPMNQQSMTKYLMRFKEQVNR